jgi:hypothetical protein
LQKRLQRTGGSRGANQNIDGTAESHARPVDGQYHLFRIRDIGANTQRVSARLLDFDVRQINFGFAPPH